MGLSQSGAQRRSFVSISSRSVDCSSGFTWTKPAAGCRLSALLDVPLLEAAQYVVPVAVTAHDSVERLRTWARGRCLSAQHRGRYQRNDAEEARTTSEPRSRRRVSREAAANGAS